MNTQRYILCQISIAFLLVTGCRTVRNNVARTEEYLHAERPTYLTFDRETEAKFLTRQGHPVNAHCVQSRFGYRDDGKRHPERHDDECLYFSVSLTELPDRAFTDPDERDDVVGILAGVSDMNCGNYLFRVFASKSGLDTAKNIFKDLSTAAAAGSAPFAPAVASGLGLSNLLLGTTVDNINTTYYFEKTFQAMESAISEQRFKLRKELFDKRGKSMKEYPFMDALNDVRSYADACSIQQGLARLVEMTGEKKAEASEDLQASVDPTHSAKAKISDLQSQLAKLQAQQEVGQSKQAIETAQKTLKQASVEATAAALAAQATEREERIDRLTAQIRDLQAALQKTSSVQPVVPSQQPPTPPTPVPPTLPQPHN
jgi:hypothetical protein